MTDDMHDRKTGESVEDSSMQRTSNDTSKKGLFIGVVVLVAVIAIAAIAYNALAPTASDDGNRIVANTSSSSSLSSDEANYSSGSSESEQPQLGDVGQASGEDGVSDEDKTLAPDFTVTDSGGAEASLTQFRGKPVVLNFWASTCGPCQSEMPEFQSAYEGHGNEIQFMMVDVVGFNGETENRAKDFIEESEYTFPVLFDSNEDASMKYGLSSIPRTFFIDAEGYVVAMASGAMDAQSLERGIEMILG